MDRPLHTQKIYSSLYALLKSVTGKSVNPTQIEKIQKQSEEFVKAIEAAAKDAAETYIKELAEGNRKSNALPTSNSSKVPDKTPYLIPLGGPRSRPSPKEEILPKVKYTKDDFQD